jgi:hypothetical protein
MARAGYNDDQNNPRFNFVPHIAGSDAERGIPAVGKLVYRTDLGSYQMCTATTPDPTLYGGGTWAGLGGGGYATWTPVLEQGGTTFTCTVIYSRIRSDGGRVDGSCALQITAGTGGATFPVKLSGMTPLAGTGAIGGGYYYANVGAARFDGWLAPGLLSGVTVSGLSKIGATTSLGTAETLTVGDVVVAEFWYPI